MWNMPAEPEMSAPRVEMFSGPGCAYCARSRELLDARSVPFVEYDVSEPEHMAEYQARLPRISALPQIFIDGEHIGSFEDLQELDQSGRLTD